MSVQTESSPWLAARQEWNDRFSSLVVGARNWRLAFFVAAAVAGLAAAGNVVQATKAPRFTTWIVVADSHGQIMSSGPADHTPVVDDQLKRAALARWVSTWRGVTSDQRVQEQWVRATYDMIASGSAAQREISEYFTENQPYNRATSELVTVQVRSVLPTSDRTYRVQWGESVRSPNGEQKSEAEWEASLTLSQSAPRDEAQARVNPLGLYVMEASWARSFGGRK